MNKFILAFVLTVASAVCFGASTDTPKVFFVGGGTNKKAVQEIVDNAISNTLFYIDWEMGSRLTADSLTWLSPNSPTNQVLTTSTPIFQVSTDNSVKALPMVECYSDVSTPVYVAVNEIAEGQEYGLVFTSAVVGQPIDFKLRITLMPYQGVSGTASRIVIFNLRRTF